MTTAVVLLSGGLDSATALAMAVSRGRRVFPFHVQYGQRHAREAVSAGRVAKAYGLDLQVSFVSTQIPGSALTDMSIDVPAVGGDGIPVTYVPARNTFLLGLAASYAEGIGADEIWVGFNAVDYSGYPDCRPEFVAAMNAALAVGMKRPVKIVSPIIVMSKVEIVALALSLEVPLQHTWSCYVGGDTPCGACDSCRIRAEAFRGLGALDPAHA